MAGRSHQFDFILDAQLGGGFSSAFKEAQQSIKEMQKEIDALNKTQGDIKAYEKQQKAVENTGKKLENLKKQYDNIQREIEETGTFSSKLENQLLSKQQAIENTSAALDGQTQKLDEMGAALNEAGVDTGNLAQESERLAQETEAAKQEQAEMAEQLQDTGSSLTELESALTALGAVEAFKKLAEGFKECIDASMEFESAITGVFKTVDGSEQQLDAISDGIKRMSTEMPVAVTEIAGIAEAAGQLGIATGDVLEFTSVMADMSVATNMSAEQAATQLARFANITGMASSDFERLGSSIVKLGNNFATTESEIVDMGMRLASTGTLVGLTESEIMALSATLTSLGISAEAGGTAISKLMQSFDTMVATGSGELEKFAEVAGMSATEFSDAWGKDAMGAIGLFVDGLGRVQASGGSVAAVLDDLGIKQSQQIQAISSLATSNGMLTNALEMSNSAWEENSALSEEAALRYGTLESKMQMLENSATLLKTAIGDALAPALGNLADVGTDAFAWMAEVIENNPELIQGLAAAAAGLGVLLAGVTAFSVVPKIFELASKAFTVFTTALTGGSFAAVAIAIAAVATAVGVFIAAANQADPAVQRLNNRLNESAAAFEEWKAAAADESSNLDGLIATLDKYTSMTNRSEAQTAVMLGVINELNAAIPGLDLSWNEETNALNMGTEAVGKKKEAYEGLRDQKKIAEEIKDAEVGLAETDIELARVEDQLADARERNNNKAFDSVDAYMASYGMLSQEQQEVMELEEKYDGLVDSRENQQEALDSLNGQMDESVAAHGELASATEEEAAAMAEAAAEQRQYNLMLEEASGKFGIAAGEIESYAATAGTAVDEWIEAFDSFSAGVDTTTDSIVNGFEKVTTGTGQSLNDMISNVNANADAYEEYTGLMSRLSESMSEETAQHFEDLGVKGLEALRELEAGGPEAMENMNAAIARASETGLSEMERQMGEGLAEAYRKSMQLAADEISGDTAIQDSLKENIETATDSIDEIDLSGKGTEMLAPLSEEIAADTTVSTALNENFQSATEGLSEVDLSGKGSEMLAPLSEEIAADTTVQTALNDNFQSAAEGVAEVDLTGAVNTMMSGASAAVAADATLVAAITAKAQEMATALNDPAIPAAATTVMAAAGAAVASDGTVVAGVQSIAAQAAAAFRSYTSAFSAAGSAMIQGAIAGANSMRGALIATMTSIAAAATAAYKSALDINSPSKTFMALGESTIEGYIIGVDNKEAEMAATMAHSVDTGFEAAANEAMYVTALAPQLTDMISAQNYSASAQSRSTAAAEPVSVMSNAVSDGGISIGEVNVSVKVEGGASPETAQSLRGAADDIAARVREVIEEMEQDRARRRYR